MFEAGGDYSHLAPATRFSSRQDSTKTLVTSADLGVPTSDVFIRGEPPNKKTSREGHPYR
jgi:hypothetical protein